jgi:DNA-directed RNA polymerase I, II, and III subunit RPABC2
MSGNKSKKEAVPPPSNPRRRKADANEGLAPPPSDPTEVPPSDTNEEDMPTLAYASENLKEKFKFEPPVRAQVVLLHPNERVTSEVMSKFELCEVISIRAKQIENGQKVFTEIGALTDPLEIAKKEVLDRRCPLSIIRMLTDTIGEKWHVNELGIPSDVI